MRAGHEGAKALDNRIVLGKSSSYTEFSECLDSKPATKSRFSLLNGFLFCLASLLILMKTFLCIVLTDRYNLRQHRTASFRFIKLFLPAKMQPYQTKPIQRSFTSSFRAIFSLPLKNPSLDSAMKQILS